jgi:hypothetical protein
MPGSTGAVERSEPLTGTPLEAYMTRSGRRQEHVQRCGSIGTSIDLLTSDDWGRNRTYYLRTFPSA